MFTRPRMYLCDQSRIVAGAACAISGGTKVFRTKKGCFIGGNHTTLNGEKLYLSAMVLLARHAVTIKAKS